MSTFTRWFLKARPFLSFKPFSQPEQERLTSLLRSVLLAHLLIPMVLALAYFIAAEYRAFKEPGIALVIFVTAALIDGGLWILMRRGYVRLAATLLIIMFLALFTMAAYRFGGVFSGAAIGFYIILAMAGLLLGRNTVVIVALLSILILAVLTVSGSPNLMVTASPRVSPLQQFLTHATGLAVTAIIIRLTINSLYEALKKSERAQAMLEEHQALLEKRVKARTAELVQANQLLQQEIAERREAEQILTTRTRELTALHEMSQVMTTRGDTTALIEAILTRSSELLGTEMSALMLCEGNSSRMRLVNRYNHPLPNGVWEVELGQGLGGHILQSGRPLAIQDYRTWSHRVETIPGNDQIGRILGVPLLFDGRITGVLTVFDHQPGSFTLDKIRLLELFAAQAATTIEQVRLLEAEREQRHLAEALHQVGTSLNEDLDFELVMDRLLEEVERVLKYDTAGIVVIKAGEAQAVRQRGHSSAEVKLSRRTKLKIADTPNLKLMVETKSPVVVSDTAADPQWVVHPELAHIRSWAGAPIILQDQVIGFLSLAKCQPGFYQPSHARRLIAFAAQAALALKNARLFEQATTALAQMRNLYQASQTLLKADLDPQYLQDFVDKVAAMVAADWVVLVTVDEESWTVTNLCLGGPSADLLPYRDRTTSCRQLWDDLIRWVAPGLRPVLRPKNQRDGAADQMDHLAGSTIIAPVHYGASIRGSITAGRHLLKPDFGQQDITLLSTVTNQATAVLENFWFFQETQRRAGQLESLQRISHDLVALHDLDELLYQIAERAFKLLDRNGAGIAIYHSDKDVLVWTVWISKFNRPRLVGQTFKRGEGVSGQVLEHGQPIIINDYAAWSGKTEKYHDITGAMVGVPIQWHDDFLGVLTITANLDAPFTQADTDILSQFATQAALAIDNARLHEQAQMEIQERKLAQQQTQTSLKEKEILLKEVNHRVKNNLQIISSLLDLQSGYIADDRAKQLLVESRNRVKSMAMIHQQLYQAQNLSQIEFDHYLYYLATSLISSYRIGSAIKLEPVLSPVALPVDKAIPCGLIVNELLTNALKYAFPTERSGTIFLTLEETADRTVTILVGDDGIGLPNDIDVHHTTSLGLQLVNLLTNQLQGTLEFSRDSGTTFRLTFLCD